MTNILGQLRVGRPSDCADCFRMVRDLYSFSDIGLTSDVLNAQWFEHRFALFCEIPDAFVCVLEGTDGLPHGVLIAGVGQTIFSPKRVAEEMAFWIDEEYRGGNAAKYMIQWAESWARTAGCVLLGLTSYDERVSPFYERLGYGRGERKHHKVLV